MTRKILLIDDNQEHAASTIQIFESSEDEDIKDKYFFLRSNCGGNLGCTIVAPNEREDEFRERCEKAFQLVMENVHSFDILMIDGFLLNSEREKNELVSLKIVNWIFSKNLHLNHKNLQKIYIITGYNTKITRITGSDIYKKNKENLCLLIRPTDSLRKDNEPEYCIIRDTNGEKCTRWNLTVYSDPTLSKRCTYEECLIDVFKKAERSK